MSWQPARSRARAPFAISCVLGAFALTSTASAESGSIGLAFTDIKYAIVQTEGHKECPDGLQAGEVEQFKTDPKHRQHVDDIGGGYMYRGPNGMTGNASPTELQDTVPWRELKTPVGYGFNLDGTADGAATAKTCKHEKFTSPEGLRVDNQMARVVGCVMGWRTTGFMDGFYTNEIETSPNNRHLVEITGVDDEKNDPQVEVAIYKGRDRLVRKGTEGYIPYISHRVDDRFPQFIYKGRGKIVDGVLTTDPIPKVRMPHMLIAYVGERIISDFQLRLKLTPDGAEGVMGGYEDLAAWWSSFKKMPSAGIGMYSPAGVFRAAQRNADGYPDPKTGQCTAISTAYNVKAVRAIIVHPKTSPVAAAPEERSFAAARE